MSKLRKWHLTILGCALISTVILINLQKSQIVQKCLASNQNEKGRLPTIFAITPTYARLVQKAELTRLAHTFLHLQDFHWIIVEDADNKTQLVTSFLQNSSIQHTHLYMKTNKNLSERKGALQRNRGLAWLRDTYSLSKPLEGVVYFADDDNVYSLQLFKEMRDTKKVSVWPVAFVGGLLYETIELDGFGKFKGWGVKYAPNRDFAIDMAGFAVNLNLVLSKPNVWFQPLASGGFMESNFLKGMTTIQDLEFKADNCTKILVWHTRTEQPHIGPGQAHTDLKMEI